MRIFDDERAGVNSLQNLQPKFDPLSTKINPILPTPPEIDFAPSKPMYAREPLLPPPPSPVHNLQGGLVGYHDPMTNLIQPASPGGMPLQVDPGGYVRDTLGNPVGQMIAVGTMGPPNPITLG